MGNSTGTKTVSDGLDWAHAAFILSFQAGIIQLALGLIGFGFVVDLVSEPVIVGFTSAAAFLILSTQFHSLFGIYKCDNNPAVRVGVGGEMESLLWQLYLAWWNTFELTFELKWFVGWFVEWIA